MGDDKPKYLNSPETPVFHKGKELYGLYEARQSYRELPRLLVVEGYMDVVALAQFGIRYAAATLGTACGEDHLALAFKYTQEVVFCFDGDEAGRNAAKRALENSLSSMRDGRQVKFLFLPDGEDPDSLVRQIGPEKFTHMVDLAVPLEDFLFDSVADGIDIQSMEGRARLSKRSAPLLHRLPPGVFRELMFANLAQRTGLAIDTLMELVDRPEERPAPAAPVESSRQPAPASEHALPPHAAPAYQHADHHYTHDYVNNYSGHRSDNAGPARTAAHAAVDSRPAATAAGQSHSAMKLPPSKLLCALVLQHPELIPHTPATPQIEANDDADLQLFVELLNFLKQRPNYSLPRILGHWRGAKGAAATDELAKLATVELLNEARLRGSFNARQEYLDCLQRIEDHLHQQKQRQELEKLSSKAFNELSEAEKQQIRQHYASQAKPRH